MLIVAVLALRSPRDSSTAAGTGTRSVSEPAPSSVARRTTPAGTTPHKSTASSATRSSRSVSSPAAVRRGALPLIVLNNSGTVGLAEQARQQFTSGGWQVSATEDNYVNRILSSAAYYDPTVPTAKPVALLLQQQFPAIKRVVPKFEGLPAGPIVVVLTTDYTID